MTVFWSPWLFVLALAVGYLARRIIERYQEDQRDRALLALGNRRPKRPSRNLLTEKRAIWLFGALTGWASLAYVHTHEWEAACWALLGVYGLVDVKRLNRKIRSRRRG